MPRVQGGEQFLTPKEVASLLRVGRRSAYTMVHHRAIPHIRLGRRILFARSLIEAWMLARVIVPVEPSSASAQGIPGQQVPPAPAGQEANR